MFYSGKSAFFTYKVLISYLKSGLPLYLLREALQSSQIDFASIRALSTKGPVQIGAIEQTPAHPAVDEAISPSRLRIAAGHRKSNQYQVSAEHFFWRERGQISARSS